MTMGHFFSNGTRFKLLSRLCSVEGRNATSWHVLKEPAIVSMAKLRFELLLNILNAAPQLPQHRKQVGFV